MLLLRFWVDIDRGGGGPLEFFSSTGCGGYYAVGDLGVWGWDNIASSAEPYCGRAFNLYEGYYQDHSLAVRYMDSYISYLGALNDAVSSWDTAN
jgi:hypothetical protein